MADKLVKSVLEVSWHRNGVGGRGFYAVRFVADIDEVGEDEAKLRAIMPGGAVPDAKWLAVLTDTPGECYVICTDLLESRGVRFGANSWRGDIFEPELREAIRTTASSGSVRVGPFGLPTG